MTTNTARIAKNTLALYFRQILIILVNLYTVRVVLNTLGAEDYGIYTTVAGVITMLGFLSNSLGMASQRYFSFEIGRGNVEQLKNIFNLNFTIYLMIIAVILLLAETGGLWFVNNKLALPSGRKNAAIWLYQFSVISFVFSILVSPYMASVIAHEDMNSYAYISIIEAMLKLGMVFILRNISFDKLKLYGILICVIHIINTAIYSSFCRFKYQECKFKLYWDKDLFKEIGSYMGLNLLGQLSGIFRNQGITILLNQFFGATAAASRSIALSINSYTVTFSYNFNMVLQPQIIKKYAAGEKSGMLEFVFFGAKGTYFLMYLAALPLMLEMDQVLRILLGRLPQYTVLFSRLALIELLIETITYPITTAVQATGRIKLFQFVVGGLLILNLPVSLMLLTLDAPVYSVAITAICLSCMAITVRLVILKRLVPFSIFVFLKRVILPICTASIVSAIFPIFIYCFMEQDLLRLFILVFVSVLISIVCVYLLGLNRIERIQIKKIIFKVLGI
jgi:O-antigen/teichoic acid export membrane protein